MLVDRHPPAGFSAAKAVQPDVLEDEHRVGKRGGFDDHVVGLLRGAWGQDHKPRVVRIPRLNHVGVVRAASGTGTKRNTHRHRTIGTPTPAQHGCVVDQRVVRQRRKAPKLDFSHRPHARQGGSNGGVNDDCLAQGHVDEQRLMPSVSKPHVETKGSSDLHVFTDEDRVAALSIGHVGHGLLNRSSVGPPALFSIGPGQLPDVQRAGRRGLHQVSAIEPMEVTGVRLCTVEARHAFRNGRRLRPRHGIERLKGLLNGGGFLNLHGVQVVFIDAEFKQQRTVRRDRVFGFPIVQQRLVDVALRRSGWGSKVQVVVVVGVPTTPHCLDVDERRPTAFEAKLPRDGHAGVDGRRV